MERINRQGIVGLEQRLELLNQLGALKLQYLKRLYERKPVWERYLGGELLHVHGSNVNASIGVCATFQRDTNTPDILCPLDNKMRMLVFVGQNPQTCKPIRTIVRLNPLEQCDVYVADAFEKCITMTPKRLFAIFNRELDEMADLLRAGVLEGNQCRKIIEGRTEAIGELADDHPKFRRSILGAINVRLDSFDTARPDINVIGNQFRIAANVFDPILQIRQMFMCPAHLTFDVEKLWKTHHRVNKGGKLRNLI
jgi:hypothetical protein